MDIPTTQPPRLEDAPLRTPESLLANPRSAFEVLPAWLHSFHLEYPEGHEDDAASFLPVVVLVLGKSHVTVKGFSLLQFAFLMELTRFRGISVVTNGNGSGLYYVRISFDGYPEDLTTISRVFAGAAEYDQTKVAGSPSDMRAENLRNDPADKVGKDARHVVFGHAKRIADALEANGKMPAHLTAEAYLANLHHLLDLCDREALGVEHEGYPHVAGMEE